MTKDIALRLRESLAAHLAASLRELVTKSYVYPPIKQRSNFA